jgi:hypothetical protein
VKNNYKLISHQIHYNHFHQIHQLYQIKINKHINNNFIKINNNHKNNQNNYLINIFNVVFVKNQYVKIVQYFFHHHKYLNLLLQY